MKMGNLLLVTYLNRVTNVAGLVRRGTTSSRDARLKPFQRPTTVTRDELLMATCQARRDITLNFENSLPEFCHFDILRILQSHRTLVPINQHILVIF